MKRIVTVCLAAGLLTGCAGIGVDPWDRGVLARADMHIWRGFVSHGHEAHKPIPRRGGSL